MTRHHLQKSLLAAFAILIVFGLFQNCGPAKVSTETSASSQSADPAAAPVTPLSTPTPAPSPNSFKITTLPVAQDVTSTSADIAWSLSDFATGQVDYGLTINYGSMSTPEMSFNYSTHIQNISGLRPGTTYHFRVRSVNADGYEAISDDTVFTTQP